MLSRKLGSSSGLTTVRLAMGGAEKPILEAGGSRQTLIPAPPVNQEMKFGAPAVVLQTKPGISRPMTASRALSAAGMSKTVTEFRPAGNAGGVAKIWRTAVGNPNYMFRLALSRRLKWEQAARRAGHENLASYVKSVVDAAVEAQRAGPGRSSRKRLLVAVATGEQQ